MDTNGLLCWDGMPQQVGPSRVDMSGETIPKAELTRILDIVRQNGSLDSTPLYRHILMSIDSNRPVYKADLASRIQRSAAAFFATMTRLQKLVLLFRADRNYATTQLIITKILALAGSIIGTRIAEVSEAEMTEAWEAQTVSRFQLFGCLELGECVQRMLLANKIMRRMPDPDHIRATTEAVLQMLHSFFESAKVVGTSTNWACLEETYRLD